jgi:antitoxin component of MazEF toxin-antitoxin module
METYINSWGNSLAVRLPKNLSELYGLSKGASVDISAIDGGIFLRPIKDPLETMKEMVADVDIEAMCAAITDENRPSPEDFDFGVPMGKEIW